LNSISRRFGRNQEGGEFLAKITETEFLTGLTRVKAKTLSGIGSGSRVRSGPGLISRVRVAGLSRLAGLSSGKTKTSPRVYFSLIPQPRLGYLVKVGLVRLGRVRPLPLDLDRINFLFLKSFINSNHFDLNSNLNYERLLHIK
jgi:hypothetical protein